MLGHTKKPKKSPLSKKQAKALHKHTLKVIRRVKKQARRDGKAMVSEAETVITIGLKGSMCLDAAKITPGTVYVIAIVHPRKAAKGKVR